MNDDPERRPCPKCGAPAPHGAAVRQRSMSGWNLVDMGFECRACGHEWGFEVLTEPQDEETP